MCGIAGAFYFDLNNEHNAKNCVDAISEALKKRGPDAYGFWQDDTQDLAFGHRRLSILDLNSRSDQPMLSPDQRYVIVFNGEIYNFNELKKELESKGEVFQTTGDTEVIVRLYSLEKEKMLDRLRGMFAITIWDRQEKVLFMARDPYGIKPLYYTLNDSHLLFASQVKALLASNQVGSDPSPQGQAGFWLTGSVPEPYTWFKNIQSLAAGTYQKINAQGKVFEQQKYWNIADTWKNAPICELTLNEAQEKLRAAVFESVKKHLVSDVPVGLFLSGGIDSASIAGLVKDVTHAQLTGITIAFDEFNGKHEDESPLAQEIAEQYGFKHHIRKVTRSEFETDLPRILQAMDQPSIDGINTWYATKAAAELGIKVVLSGVGGDELFYGYPSFQQIPKLTSYIQKLTFIQGLSWLASLIFGVLAIAKKNSRWKYIVSEGQNLYGSYWLRRGLYTPEDLPQLMGKELAKEALDYMKPQVMIKNAVGNLPLDSSAAVGQLESMFYLRNQLLRDSDWASMNHSVELRTPLVDAWLLKEIGPIIRCFGKYKGKELLARSPNKPLDDKIIYRRKTGFGLPLGLWLQSALDKNENLKSKTNKNVSQSGSDSRHWAKILTEIIYKI